MTAVPFIADRHVRPRHCDAQGVVHAARYHDFFEEAFLGWLEANGAPYSTLRAGGVDLVIAESRCRYHRPARLDDRVQVTVTSNTVTDSSLTADFEIRRHDDLLTTGDITYVVVTDGRRGRTPAALQRLTAYLERTPEQLVDALHEAQGRLYADGDASTIGHVLDPDVVWRVPGNNLIAGTYRGVEEVVGYMLRRRELAGATFRMYRRELLVGPIQFAALTDGTVDRAGTTHSWSTVGLYRARQGRIMECALIPSDPATFDAAWS